MVAASRIVAVPPARWDELRLLAAARAVPAPSGPVRPGDPLGDLVVVRVEPEAGAEASARTPVEVRPAPRAPTGATLDVAILLDASASMAQPWSATHSRWQGARDAVRAFLASPGRNLRLVSLFIFAREAHLVAGPLASSKVTLPELTPRGRAMTGTALNAALAHLCDHASDLSSQAVLVLSDGAGEAAELQRAGERAARLGVAVHSLVFAPDDDPAFAALAAATGGTSQRATWPPSFALVHEPPKEASS